MSKLVHILRNGSIEVEKMHQEGSINHFVENRHLFAVIFFLSLVSATSLAYQTWQWFTTGECGCNPAFNEHAVIFGVPVSLIGMIGMMTFAVFALYFFFGSPSLGMNVDASVLYKVFFGLLSVGLVFVLYLMYISYIVVGELCELCLISQIITMLNWLIGLRIFMAIS